MHHFVSKYFSGTERQLWSKASHEMTQKRAMMRLQRIMLADALRIRYAILITGDTLLLSATIIRKSSAR